MRIAIGADHYGFRLKEAVRKHLEELGHEVDDFGVMGEEPVDYPDVAHEVARLVAEGRCRWGIVVDGAGIGSCMTANKVPGVRAATCWDLSSARNSREHNHANVLALGAGLLGESLALQIVREWLATPWGEERHARRVAKITDIERRYGPDHLTTRALELARPHLIAAVRRTERDLLGSPVDPEGHLSTAASPPSR